MIYATDLDRTIIFSSKFINNKKNIICVEKKGNNPISYMTMEAISKFKELKEKNNLKIIPVTTRSLEQFKRVEPVQDCEFAITSNGGIILKNGEILESWQKYIENILDNYKKDFEVLEKYILKFKDCYERNPKLIDNTFVFMKLLNNEDKIKKILIQLDNELDKSKWAFTLQGLKLYIIPKEINKENALLYLKEYLKEDIIITSGDGKLDYNFLKVGNIRIIPKNSEVLNYLENDFTYEMVSEGLDGTIELFKIIEKQAS